MKKWEKALELLQKRVNEHQIEDDVYTMVHNIISDKITEIEKELGMSDSDLSDGAAWYDEIRENMSSVLYDKIFKMKSDNNEPQLCRYTCFDRVLHLIKPVESEEWQKDIVYLMQYDGLSSLLDYLVEKNIITRDQSNVIYDGIVMWEDLDGNYFEEDFDKMMRLHEALGITEDIFNKYMEK